MKELSDQVKISLEDSKTSLREALAFAAKVEDPNINIAISQLMMGVDNLLKYYEKSKDPFDDMIRRHFGG